MIQQGSGLHSHYDLQKAQNILAQAAEVRTAKTAGVDVSPMDRHRWHHAYLSGAICNIWSTMIARQLRQRLRINVCCRVTAVHEAISSVCLQNRRCGHDRCCCRTRLTEARQAVAACQTEPQFLTDSAAAMRRRTAGGRHVPAAVGVAGGMAFHDGVASRGRGIQDPGRHVHRQRAAQCRRVLVRAGPGARFPPEHGSPGGCGRCVSTKNRRFLRHPWRGVPFL